VAPVCTAGAGGDKDEELQRVGAQLLAVQPEDSAHARCRSLWRHAVVAIAVDLVVCLVLFAAWLGYISLRGIQVILQAKQTICSK
jgi:hypothetical protein